MRKMDRLKKNHEWLFRPSRLINLSRILCSLVFFLFFFLCTYPISSLGHMPILFLGSFNFVEKGAGAVGLSFYFLRHVVNSGLVVLTHSLKLRHGEDPQPSPYLKKSLFIFTSSNTIF